jgi:ANTAR domain
MSGNGADERDDVVVRKAERGWVVGKENVSDLTSAMVLADLFAADQADGDNTGVLPPADEHAAAGPPAPRTSVSGPQLSSGGTATFVKDESTEAERLAVTVTQLEHALASRVRVEQAIGILAERHRLRPREAFDLLRKAARARGRRVTELAHDVVESAANPLLRLPDELARTAPEPRQRGRSTRRGRHAM